MATEITINEHLNPLGVHHLDLNVEGNHTDVFVTPSAEFVEGWLIYTRDVTRNMYFEDRFVVAIGVTGSTEAQTIQLFVKDRCLVFQLSHSHEVPPSLRSFLVDPTITFVAYRSEHLMTKLQQSRFQLDMFHIPFDIVQSVRRRRFFDGQALRPARIEEIARDYLGIHGVTMPLAVDSNDWDVHYLTVEQVKQVALEAFITYRYAIYNETF